MREKLPKGLYSLTDAVHNIKKINKDTLGFFLNCTETFGDICLLRFGAKYFYLLNHPDFIKHVLVDNNKNYVKSFTYDELKPALGQGLLTSEGDFWRRQRRLAQPAFHRQHLAQLFNVIKETTADTIAQWQSQDDKNHQSVDIAKEMMRLTLRIVGKALLSVDLDHYSQDVHWALTSIMENSVDRLRSLIKVPRFLPTNANRRERQAVQILEKIVYDVIAKRQKNPQPQHDLLAMLMNIQDEDTGEKMSVKQLRDEMITFILAGHETTANALSWTFYLLLTHPDVLKKLQTEIREHRSAQGLAYADVAHMPYSLMVIEEAMRLYPPAWMIERQALADDHIGGYLIPHGSTVMMCQYTTHRYSRWWPNPHQFDPERFSPEQVKSRPKFVYYPFGGGPRICIGSHFALLESQVILTMMLDNFQFELVPGQEILPEPLVTLRPQHGVWVKVTPTTPSLNTTVALSA